MAGLGGLGLGKPRQKRAVLRKRDRTSTKKELYQMIAIDSEFQSLIPPLSDDEYERLEKSILSEGVRDPIITWNGTIIDGHNRYNICQEHDIECPQVEKQFASRDAAKIWIIGNQLGRRNLEAGQKAALVIERNEAKVRERARLRQVQAGKESGRGMARDADSLGSLDPKLSDVTQQFSLAETEPEKGRTAEILARQAGVGSATIKRALRIKKEDPTLYEQVRKGEVAVTSAYEQVKPSRPKTAEDGRRICSICGKPIDEGGHYQDKLNWHYQCGLKHVNEVQRKYRDADSDLRNNVAVYTIESLKAELLASAESMKEALKESIAINESMGVQLTAKQKKDLSASVAHVIRTINRI